MCSAWQLDLFKLLPSPTDNRILASVYGGILQGIGVGIFVKFKVSSGGTELLGRVIQRFLKFLSIPACIAVLDSIIVISGRPSRSKTWKTSFTR